MTKKEVLNRIRQAKAGHKRWVSYAKALHMGIGVDKYAVPVIETDCQFGKWYYGDAQVFSKLPSYQSIEDPHAMLHNKYMEIYKLREQPLKKGLFTSEKKAKQKREEEISMLMDQLIQISNMLMESLAHFEEDVENMSEDEVLKLTT